MRSKVVEVIVEGLLDHEINNFVGEWPLFDPAYHVSQLLKFEYGLSLLIYFVDC